MKKLSMSLIGLTLLIISPLALAATGVSKSEPTGDIVRNGQDIEWNAESNAGYMYAAEQKEFRVWMRQTYLAWKTQWQEPLNQERFSAEHRHVRQILTAAHRHAVRTGEWNARPDFTVSMSKVSKSLPEKPVMNSAFSRPSRRLIVLEALHSNVVKVPATMR
jgi:hypothetical protein